MRELVCANIGGSVLIGTLHLPEPEARQRTAFLFVNAGYAPRDGHGGLSVMLCERLASEGFYAFRFDLPMLGDASNELPETLDEFVDHLCDGGYTQITLELIGRLKHRYGLDGVVIGGLCGGTITAIYAADQDDAKAVAGLVLLEPEFVLSKPMPAAAPDVLARVKKRLPQLVQKIADKACSYWGWMRFITYENRMASWIPFPRRQIIEVIFRQQKIPSVTNRPLVAAWRRVVHGQLPVFVVTAKGKMRELFFDQINTVALRGVDTTGVEHHRLDRTNHIFTTGNAVEVIAGALSAWSRARFPVGNSSHGSPTTACRENESGLRVSVVIATYNRIDALRNLLIDLDRQTISPSSFEVIVVDDGSDKDVSAQLAGYLARYKLLVLRQANGGAAVARQTGAEQARSPVLVFVDDDMSVRPDFLQRHAEMHEDDRTVVLGALRSGTSLGVNRAQPLIARFHAKMLDRRADEYVRGRERPKGHSVYTGNLSISQAIFFRTGGFDTTFQAIEDEELGIRLEKAGARILFEPRAVAAYEVNNPPMDRWAVRAYRDGVYSLRVARKHPDHLFASPWRHLSNIRALSKPFIAFSFAAPGAAGAVADMAAQIAHFADEIGLEETAVAGMTLVYGMHYYRGVRGEFGDFSSSLRDYRAFQASAAIACTQELEASQRRSALRLVTVQESPSSASRSVRETSPVRTNVSAQVSNPEPSARWTPAVSIGFDPGES